MNVKINLLVLLFFLSLTKSFTQISLDSVTTYRTGLFDEGGTEIIAYEPISKRLFSTNGYLNRVDVFSVGTNLNMQLIDSILLDSIGGGVNSVDVKGNVVAVAVENDSTQLPGFVVLYDTLGNYIQKITVGALPDMVVITPDMKYVLAACEGEPNQLYSHDPDGEVAIIDISDMMNISVNIASFNDVSFFENFEVNKHDTLLVKNGWTTNSIYVNNINDRDPYSSYKLGMNGNSDYAISPKLKNPQFISFLASRSSLGANTFNIELALSKDKSSWMPFDTLYASTDFDTLYQKYIYELNQDTTVYIRFRMFNRTGYSFYFDDFSVGMFDSKVDVFSNPGYSSIAQDLEPEYIAVDSSSSYAYVSLQENNAFAVIDIKNATVDTVFSCGLIDRSISGYGFDPSDKNGFAISNFPVYGMFMPDALSYFETSGKSYIITANEGDAREYDAYVEIDRVKNLTLDSAYFASLGYDINDLQKDNQLGKLNVKTTLGDIDNDGKYEELYSFGGRSFSIFTTEGQLIFDSKDDFETIIHDSLPLYYNANNDENVADKRSDDKGPEPEAVCVGVIDGKVYAFVALERVGGIMVYDITNPANPTFVLYENSRNFDQAVNTAAAGDLGPEKVMFIPETKSPNGKNLLMTSNEISGTITIYSIEKGIMTSDNKVQSLSNSFNVYPNPVKENYIFTGTLSDYELYDFTGRMLNLYQSVDRINLAGFSAGNYILRNVRTGETAKFIKE